MFGSKDAARTWTLNAFQAFVHSLPAAQQNRIWIPKGKTPTYCIAIVGFVSFSADPACRFYARWVIPFGKQYGIDKTSAVLLAHCFAHVLLPVGFGVDIYQMRGLSNEKVAHLGPGEDE